MSSCNIVEQIAPSECIGDSLVKINNNFSSLDGNVCNLVGFISSIAQIRLSLSNTLPIITNDIANASTVYLHPYKGNAIGLYDTINNKWNIKNITSVLSFSLGSLAANTNYDIFLYHNGTNLELEFAQWSSSSKGSVGPTKALIDGVKVKQSDYSKRYIGCLRTTLAGRTEVSFGRKWVLGGSHPKFFLWNAYNQVSSAFSIFDGAHWYVTGPGNGSANANGPFSNFGYRNVSTDGTNYRVSFITGEPIQINMHQDHWHQNTWAYLAHGLDLEQSDSPMVVNLHQQGQHVSENNGQITHGSNILASEGYHFVQSLAMSYGGGYYWNYEGPVSGGTSLYPGGRHSYGVTGRISNY